jgi:hypothetical protein
MVELPGSRWFMPELFETPPLPSKTPGGVSTRDKPAYYKKIRDAYETKPTM